jgi:nitrous oxidase accessory protein NosD
MASKATVTSVASSASSVTLFNGNADRSGIIISNPSTAILYVRLQSSATSLTAATATTGHSFQMASLATVDLGAFRGAATGIWASANGSAQITELE